MSELIQQKIVQTTTYAADSNILAEGGDGEYFWNHEMIFPRKGNSDWSFLNAEKFKIAGCKVEIIPQYNLCTSGDAPVGIINYNDYENAVKLMTAVIKELNDSIIEELSKF